MISKDSNIGEMNSLKRGEFIRQAVEEKLTLLELENKILRLEIAFEELKEIILDGVKIRPEEPEAEKKCT